MIMNNKVIGQRIKTIRKDKKMTQKELASSINRSVETVKKYENGSIEIPLNIMAKIEDTLQINRGFLLASIAIYYERGEIAFDTLLADLGYVFKHYQHEIYNDSHEVLDVEESVILEHDGKEYVVNSSIERSLRKEVIAYTEFKLQQIINDCNTKEDD